jgi:predicted O-methyltransferase YrrM
MEFPDFYEHFGGSFRTDYIRMGLVPRARWRLAGGAGRGYATGGTLEGGVAERTARVASVARKDPIASLSRFGARRAAVLRTYAGPAASSVGVRMKMDPRHLFSSGTRRRHRVPPPNGLRPEFIRLDPWEGEYLFMLACRAKVGIIEIGRLHGGSTFLLSCANDEVPISSVDLEPQDDEGLTQLLAGNGVGDNVNLIVGDSQHTKYPEAGEADLLFVDGDHSYEGCMADLVNWFPHVVPGGHIVMHDGYFGSPPQEAAIDFLEQHDDVEIVRPPWIHAIHWHNPTGSLIHFRKRS